MLFIYTYTYVLLYFKENKGRTNSKSGNCLAWYKSLLNRSHWGRGSSASNFQKTREKATNKLGSFVYCILTELIERSWLSVRFMEHKTKLVRYVCEHYVCEPT